MSSSDNIELGFGVACEKRGRIVIPACPPTTGTLTSSTGTPAFAA